MENEKSPIEVSTEMPYSEDYNHVPVERRKLVIPHAAEGPNIHELSIKEKDFKIPVSFHIEGNEFYLTGLESGKDIGIIIMGNIAGESVRIKHIEVAKDLQGAGVASAMLADLERQLQEQGVKRSYAAFYKTGTVEFFLKNGYKIIPLGSLAKEQQTSLDITPEYYDPRVESEEDFRTLKATEGIRFTKILMAKDLTIK